MRAIERRASTSRENVALTVNRPTPVDGHIDALAPLILTGHVMGSLRLVAVTLLPRMIGEGYGRGQEHGQRCDHDTYEQPFRLTSPPFPATDVGADSYAVAACDQPANPITCTFRWRPSSADIGTHAVSFIATDSRGDVSPTHSVFVHVAPTVVWLPPVTHDEFVLQDGTTLPLKFRLTDALGNMISEEQDVYLALHGPAEGEGFGPELHVWEQGEGRSALRFDEEDASYVANLHTRDFEGFQDGAVYTAVVRSRETHTVFGAVSFRLSTERGTGNRRRGPG